MNQISKYSAVFAVVAGAIFPNTAQSEDAIPVTAENYHKAEAAANFDKWAKLGSDQKLFHYRDVSPTGPSAPTVRMNWDTLYSCRIVKVSDDHAFEIELPETDIYVAAQVIDEDGFSPYYIVDRGVKKTCTVNTDYAWVLFRTGVPDRKSKTALEAAHKVQDQIEITGMMEDSTYVAPNYDQESFLALRAKYTQEFLDSGSDFTYAKKAGDVDQHTLDLSHAAGWGGVSAGVGRIQCLSEFQDSPGRCASGDHLRGPEEQVLHLLHLVR